MPGLGDFVDLQGEGIGIRDVVGFDGVGQGGEECPLTASSREPVLANLRALR